MYLTDIDARQSYYRLGVKYVLTRKTERLFIIPFSTTRVSRIDFSALPCYIDIVKSIHLKFSGRYL